jgi:ADP-ribose pyrophosphatase
MKILDAVKLAQTKWLNLFEVRFVDKTGGERSWQLVSRATEPRCVTGQFEPADAVVIVPYHTVYKRLIITREYRVPLGDYEYGFPAGLIEKGESVEQAARRELKEETGLSAGRIAKVSPPVYTTSGISDESVVMVYVECIGEATSEYTTGSENIEVILATPEEATSLCGRQDLKFDAKAWLVISTFAAMGRLPELAPG